MKIFREAKGIPEPEETKADEEKVTENLGETEKVTEENAVEDEKTTTEEAEVKSVEIDVDEVAQNEDVYNEQSFEPEKTPKGNVGVFSGRKFDE